MFSIHRKLILTLKSLIGQNPSSSGYHHLVKKSSPAKFPILPYWGGGISHHSLPLFGKPCKVNSNRFEMSNHLERSFHSNGNFTAANLKISNHSQKLFRLHGDFTVATFQTITRSHWTCANDSF